LKLSILIPAYNEAATIEESIRRLLAVDFDGMATEVILVDDASTDATGKIVAGFGDCVRVIRHDLNRGKGAAIRTALAFASGDIVVIHDADLEYDPEDLPALVSPVAAGLAPASFGSRFLGGARPEGMKTQNWIANKILAIAANTLYGGRLTDEATCYKAIRSNVLRNMDLKCQRFEFCPEVTAKLLRSHQRVIEVPVHYHARTIAEGKKIHWYDGLEALWTLVKYRFVR
jgi:dolichol-phosphate mannosyltransferase